MLVLTWESKVLAVALAVAALGGAYRAIRVWGRDLASLIRRARAAGRRRRSAHQVETVSGPAPEHVRVLDAVCAYFRQQGKRAPFRVLDKQLDLDGFELRPAAESMPKGLLLPDVGYRGGFFRDDDELLVTVEGLRFCHGGKAMLDLLARAVGYMAERERPFVPSDEQPDLVITVREFGEELGLDSRELAQLWFLLHECEPHVWRRIGGTPGDPWEIAIDTANVRRFRGVRTGEAYLQARAAQSIGRQVQGRAHPVPSGSTGTGSTRWWRSTAFKIALAAAVAGSLVPWILDRVAPPHSGANFTTQGPANIEEVGRLRLTPPSPRAGQTVSASFTVANQGPVASTILMLEAGGRLDPSGQACVPGAGTPPWAQGAQANFPGLANVVLQAGATVTYRQSLTYQTPGRYFAEPVMEISGSGGVNWVGIAGANRVCLTVAP